jgi:hypothetical protein
LEKSAYAILTFGKSSKSLENTEANRTFRNHPASLWHKHAKESGPNYGEFIALTNKLFHPANANWEAWRKWFDFVYQPSMMFGLPKDITPASSLHYAALTGLDNTVTYLTDELIINVNHVDSFYRTPLQAVAMAGNFFSSQVSYSRRVLM